MDLGRGEICERELGVVEGGGIVIRVYCMGVEESHEHPLMTCEA